MVFKKERVLIHSNNIYSDKATNQEVPQNYLEAKNSDQLWMAGK